MHFLTLPGTSRNLGGLVSPGFRATDLLLLPLAVLLLTLAGCEENNKTVNNIVVASGDGLQMMIDSVVIGGDRKPVVDFTLKDAQGTPLEIADLDGAPSFVIGWITTDPATGLTRYQSHIVRDVAGASYTFNGQTTAPALASAPQAGRTGTERSRP